MNSFKILIVDDNPQDRFIYRRLLATDGYQFVESETGEDGLRAYFEGTPDCVLLDYRLPDLTGIQFLEKLAERSEDLAAIVVLTSKGNEAVVVQALRAGAQDYLTKDGLTRENLSRAVSNAVEKVSLRRELQSRNKLLERANAELEQIKTTLESQVEQRTAELVAASVREQELRLHAENANRMKDEFLAVLSHELRTPLTAIIGWLAAIQSGRLDPEGEKTAINTVARNARAQSKLIDELLDVSGIISGKFKFSRDPIVLNDIVSAAIEVIRPEAETKRLTIARALASESIPIVGDAFRLQQAILNVLSNAVKFTPESGNITVNLFSRDDQAVVEIVDSGVGIDADFLPQIFDRFKQADGSVTRGYSGLGLGLAIVKHIVDSHGGRALAFSTGTGQGTTIRLELPVGSRAAFQQ